MGVATDDDGRGCSGDASVGAGVEVSRSWKSCHINVARSAMNIVMKLDFEDQEVGRSKGPYGVFQRMDFSRVPREIGENGVKMEFKTPGPATPMQAVPLLQQKQTEGSKPFSHTPTCSAGLSFDAASTCSEPRLAFTPLKSLFAPTTDPGQTHNENAPSPAVYHSIGHLSLTATPPTVNSPTMPVSNSQDQLRLITESTNLKPSMSTCRLIERLASDRSVTSMGRPSAKAKGESPRLSPEVGLCLGSHASQHSRSLESGLEELSRVSDNGAGMARQSGAAFVSGSRDEGAGVWELSQPRDLYARGGQTVMDEEWRGKHVEVSFGFQAGNNAEEGRVNGTVEHRFSEVLEANVGVGAEDCRDSSTEWWTKRVKREVVECGTTADEFREHLWERNGDRDDWESGLYEKRTQREDVRNLLWRNGGTGLVPQGYRENALGSGEARTVVVKKTPKRVHNSDPSAMPTRPELLMLEESAKGPGWIPQVVSTPWCKQGASDLASEQSAIECANLVLGGESRTEYVRGTGGGKSVEQLELESRLEGGSTCSLMSRWKHPVSPGEAALPLTLNFSPAPQRAAVPSCRTSTEEEWGKSLALCGPGAASGGEGERSIGAGKAMSCEERFVELQMFLKKCDEDEQRCLVDALRSLSAAGRSLHAVELEQRALLLSIEEGKEMGRLKALNVMGQRSSWEGGSEAGWTAEGPVVACFGGGGEHAQQRRAKEMRSPELQMQMQMLMSGWKGGSRHGGRHDCA